MTAILALPGLFVSVCVCVCAEVGTSAGVLTCNQQATVYAQAGGCVHSVQGASQGLGSDRDGGLHSQLSRTVARQLSRGEASPLAWQRRLQA